jgi:hypothetical protein
MPVTTAFRLVALFMLIAIAGFFGAGATDGGTVPVLVGFLGLFAAGGALVARPCRAATVASRLAMSVPALKI